MAGFDQQKLEEFKNRVVARYTRDRSACLALLLGDEPMLYAALAQAPQTPAGIAAEAGCSPRLVRELLDGQVASGHIDYDPESDRYSLTRAAAMI